MLLTMKAFTEGGLNSLAEMQQTVERGPINVKLAATIALDRRIGEPVEVMVNGRIIGRGEITVLENDDTRFGVKLIEVKSTRKI